MGKMRPTGSDEKLFIFAGMHCENIDEKNWAMWSAYTGRCCKFGVYLSRGAF